MIKTYLYYGLFIAIAVHIGVFLLPWLDWFAASEPSASRQTNPLGNSRWLEVSVHKTVAPTTEASIQPYPVTGQAVRQAASLPQYKPAQLTRPKPKVIKADEPKLAQEKPIRLQKTVGLATKAVKPLPANAKITGKNQLALIANPPAQILQTDLLTKQQQESLKSAYLKRLQAKISHNQHYPRLSRKRGEQGKVVVSLVIQADGGFEKIQIDQSSSYPRLDRSALQTLQRIERFEALPAGLGLAKWRVKVPLVFKLYN